MADLTICIPIGPGHEAIADRARASVKAQTISVNGLQLLDKDARGAGWARNQMLAAVDTPYVAFLDADDWLEPDYAERMIAALQEGRYAYSGWFETDADGNEKIVMPSAECYCFKQDNWWNVHLINAVIPTAWVKAINGFDETLPGMEDTDFFHRLHEAGHCGKLLNKPLVHYTAAGKRSKAFQQLPDYLNIKGRIGEKYNRGVQMACCQGQGITNEGPFGTKQPGDVLARVHGPTFQVYVGRQSGRIYSNVGYGQLVWADAGDVTSDPVRFQLVEQAPEPTISSAAELASFMQTQVSKPLPFDPTKPPPEGRPTPQDIARMAGLK